MPSVATVHSPNKELYRIRWAMSYADGSVRRGLWSQQGTDKWTLASMQPRDGLVKVGVEGLDRTTKHTRMLYETDAAGFERFKINFAAQVPAIAGQFLDKVGALKIHGKVWGLTICFHDKPATTIRTDGTWSSETPED